MAGGEKLKTKEGRIASDRTLLNGRALSPNGLIHHSDAGSQYTSEAYKLESARRHTIKSMSGVEKVL